MEIRRIALRGLLAAPLVLGAGVGALLWLPKLVRERVASKLEHRSGLPVQVSDVSLGFGSVALGEVVVGSATGGPSARVRAVTIDAGPLGLALRGTRAIAAVHVGELALRWPTQDPRSARVLESMLHKDASESHSGAADRRSPAIVIDRFSVDASDARGTLLELRDAQVRLGEGGGEVTAARVKLGAEPLDSLVLEGAKLQLRREPGGRLRLAGASIETARATLGARSSGGDEAAAPETGASLWSRLRAPLKARAAADSGPAGAPSAPPNGTAWIDRLTDDARLTLQHASVSEAGDAVPILAGLTASARMQPQRALSLEGTGKARGDGEVRWDLRLQPLELRADGQIVLRSLPLNLIASFLPAVPWYEPEQGRIDAELVIKTEAQGIAFSGDASLRDASVSSPRIAATPVTGIVVGLSGRGRFLPLRHRLEVAQAALKLGPAALDVSGAMEWSSDHYLFDLEADLPPTPCTRAVRAIPEDMLGDMAAATWSGKLSGHVKVKLDSRALDDTVLEIAPVDHCEFETVPELADLRRFRMPFVHSVLEPDGTLFEMETGPGTSEWTFLEDVSPYLVHAVLAHEDAGFFSHHGFSMRHIRDALVRNLKEGRYVVGASTITMQLVKNVFLHREKTLARKVQEVLLTWWLERVMEKRDILELYLNVIEYGPSVYGIRQAAKHYFNRLPSQLSPAESCFLATILPNPKRFHANFDRGSLSPGVVAEIRKMLARMRERGWYSPEAVDYGLNELASFHFSPEGTIVPARQIPGHAAPLPYMQSFQQRPGYGDDADLETTGEADDGSFEPPPRLAPRAAKATHAPGR